MIMLFCSGVVGLGFQSSVFKCSHHWQGYLTLLVDGSVSSGTVHRALTDRGYEVVDAENTDVWVSLFAETERVSVSRLETRLVAEDPRLDPYMAGLQRLFRGGDPPNARGLIFVRSRYGPAVTAVGLALRMPEYRGSVKVAEFEPLRGAIRLALFALVYGVLFAKFADRSPAYVFVAVPAAIVAAGGGFGNFAGACFVSFAGVLVLRELREMYRYYLNYRRRDIGHRSVGECTAVLIIAFSVAIVFPDVGESELSARLWMLWLLPPFAGAAVMEMRRAYREHLGREHRVFIPVYLADRKRRVGNGEDRTTLAAVFAFILIVPIAAHLTSMIRRTDVPVPLAAESARDFGWDDLALLAGYDHTGGLPDIADYVAHRAYQDTVHLRRRFAFPGRGEAVKLSDYQWTDGRIVKSDETVFLFDQQWYDGVISEGRKTGLTKMLADQGRPVLVSPARAVEIALPTLYFWLHVIAVILVFSPLIIPDGSLTAAIFYAMRNTIPRRKRQTA